MNYLIKKLKDQATTRKFDGTGTDMGKLVLDEQKFAELIVRECADVCLSGKNKENWRCTDSINKGFSDAVLDHFGTSNDQPG